MTAAAAHRQMSSTTPSVGVELRTERLLLRQTRESDVELIYETNRALNAEYESAPLLDREALAELHAHFQAEWQAHGLGYFMILDPMGITPIGHIRLKWLPDTVPGTMAELIYAIHPPYQSQGYATEAVRVVLSYAFDYVKLDYVIACIEPDNHASLRVAERNRMTAVSQGMMHGRVMKRFLISAKAWQILSKM